MTSFIRISQSSQPRHGSTTNAGRRVVKNFRTYAFTLGVVLDEVVSFVLRAPRIIHIKDRDLILSLSVLVGHAFKLVEVDGSVHILAQGDSAHSRENRMTVACDSYLIEPER